MHDYTFVRQVQPVKSTVIEGAFPKQWGCRACCALVLVDPQRCKWAGASDCLLVGLHLPAGGSNSAGAGAQRLLFPPTYSSRQQSLSTGNRRCELVSSSSCLQSPPPPSHSLFPPVFPARQPIFDSSTPPLSENRPHSFGIPDRQFKPSVLFVALACSTSAVDPLTW